MSNSSVASAAHWQGSQIDLRKQGVLEFSAGEIAELDLAQHCVRALDFSQITYATFALPTLGPRLLRMREELRTGLGFVLLRGLDRDRYAADAMARIFYGISAHLGVPIPQSFRGELIGSVIDISDAESGQGRSYHGGGRLVVHSEGCDIVGLMCWRKARSGGESRVASAIAIHQRMAQERPELAAALFQAMPVRVPPADAQAGSGKELRDLPLTTFAEAPDGSLICYYSPTYAFRAEREGSPALSPLLREAIDRFEELALSPEFYLDMPIEEGDIQYLNDRILVHARTDYVDQPGLDQRRHLFRVRLLVPQWPARAATSFIRTAEDFAGWITRRQPGADLPEAFLAKVRTKIESTQGKERSWA